MSNLPKYYISIEPDFFQEQEGEIEEKITRSNRKNALLNNAVRLAVPKTRLWKKKYTGNPAEKNLCFLL